MNIFDQITDTDIENFLVRVERIKRKITYQKKVVNARNSVAKARARGSHLGRKKLRDDEEIRKLRAAGHTIRGIAKIIGLSPTAVQRGLA